MHKRSSNRSFGVVFFVVFLAIGIWPMLNSGAPIYYLILLSLIFLILGLVNAKILSPLNSAWIKFGEILGKIIAPIVMAIIYFLILTPISLLVRLFGKDLIGMKFSNNVKSYWIKRKKHLGTMDKQF